MYLDDERMPKDDSREWVIVRSFSEGVEYIKTHGMPTYMSFDHDLGLEKSGYDFAKWIVEMDMGGIMEIPNEFAFNVHSSNPCGAANIQCFMDNYLAFKKK